MKKKITYTILISCLIANFSISQSFQWAKSMGGIASDAAIRLAIDPNGNVYTGVSCMYPTAFFGTDSFTINGFNDMFLTKFDNAGNKVWIKQFGGPNTNMTNIKQEGFGDIIYDSFSNSIITTGIFVDSADFGCNSLTTSLEDREIFLIKLDLNGNCVWSKKAGNNNSDDYSYSLATDANGYIYITASSPDTLIFDTINVGRGTSLAKYDVNGNCLWAKNIFSYSSNLGDFGSSVQIGSSKIYNNAIYLFGSNIEDTLTIDTALLQLNNSLGKILAKFDLSGNLQWYRYFAGPASYGTATLSLDNLGNCFVAGHFFNGMAIFDNDTIYASGNNDVFFAKYNSIGNKIWLTQTNGSQNAYCYSISTSGDGDTYLTGKFKGNASFGTFNITANTPYDMYIARYNNNGNCLGVSQYDNSTGASIITDANNLAYVCGNFSASTNLGITTLSSYGNTDAFVAKHDVITGIGGGNRNINNKLLIYANPNAGKCNITVPDEFLHEQNLTLSIFDNTGKLIQQQNLTMHEGKIKLNLEAEAKGLYNVSLSNGTKAYSGKIVFE